jgi:hypothetical protein
MAGCSALGGVEDAGVPRCKCTSGQVIYVELKSRGWPLWLNVRY